MLFFKKKPAVTATESSEQAVVPRKIAAKLLSLKEIGRFALEQKSKRFKIPLKPLKKSIVGFRSPLLALKANLKGLTRSAIG